MKKILFISLVSLLPLSVLPIPFLNNYIISRLGLAGIAGSAYTTHKRYLEQNQLCDAQNIAEMCDTWSSTSDFYAELKNASETIDKDLKILATGMNLPTPKLVIFPIVDAGAHQYKNKSYVWVNPYTAINTPREELRAVLGHELGHLKHGDTLQAEAMAAGTGCSVFSQLKKTGMGASKRLGLAIAAASVANRLTCRFREYRADATSAHYTQDPQSLISALKKSEQKDEEFIAKQNWRQNTPKLIADAIALKERIWSTHPPTEKRIARLQKIADKQSTNG